ncbi:isocitrate dehydrogenase [Candidatus Gracilibacteria bacterium]|nr:isocitrate dehydrogenase [Candidatus Gracilibacteria bacterium]
MTIPTIVVLEGDETGQELLEEALRVLSPAVTGVQVAFQRFDLSLKNRRATRNEVVHEAAAAMKVSGLGMKAATITPEVAGDVGSPNAIVRNAIDGTVIIRTGRRIPGVRPVGGVFAPITVVRMAVDDAYGATEWREGAAWTSGLPHREDQPPHLPCVAEVAFRTAQRTGGKVFGGPKYTVSPIYEGMLKEEMDAAAKRYSEVRYEPQLIDATYALLLTAGEKPLVIPALNRDGDCLSDLVMQMFGSIAGAESLLLALDEDFKPRVVMAEAPHGTAPNLFGKNVANPLAMILAGGALLNYIDTRQAHLAARAIVESCLESVYDDVRTADLGGHAHTDEFTAEVIKRVQTKLAVWPTMS